MPGVTPGASSNHEPTKDSGSAGDGTNDDAATVGLDRRLLAICELLAQPATKAVATATATRLEDRRISCAISNPQPTAGTSRSTGRVRFGGQLSALACRTNDTCSLRSKHGKNESQSRHERMSGPDGLMTLYGWGLRAVARARGSRCLPQSGMAPLTAGPDEQVQVLDLGIEWEPNAPDAVLITGAYGAALALNAYMDDADQRCVVFRWKHARAVALEAPNDEAISGHRLYDRGHMTSAIRHHRTRVNAA